MGGVMRLCRFERAGVVVAALFEDNYLFPLQELAKEFGLPLTEFSSTNLLDYLPPGGSSHRVAKQLAERCRNLSMSGRQALGLAPEKVKILVPIPEPTKVILLAGNYAEHIKEGGGVAAERQETFPYFFWKPPSTTLTHPGDPVRIPEVSPHHVDWEIELGVLIGKRCKNVSEQEALNFVAGYTVCNDISDRKFQINPGRKNRPKDSFFDWLHGKWHDTFLPMGPCIRSADSVADPQTFPLMLKVNGQVMQDGTTGQMIFPVSALVSILSSFVTLEPGDIISTGTPSGVGMGRKPPVFLKSGDVVEAAIEGIGSLKNPVRS